MRLLPSLPRRIEVRWPWRCNRDATMPPIADTELIRRLLTAAVLGAMLGFEREIRQKSAGLRTNILIAVGSALFTLMSLELAPAGSDPGRIAAQIVTGIGFLGAARSCAPTPASRG